MQAKRFGDVWLVRIDAGEDIPTSLLAFAEENDIKLATLGGLGAVDHAKYGLFDPEQKKFVPNIKDEYLEVVSVDGTLSTMGGKPYLHLHATFADVEGRVFGGHVNEARVSATAEISVHIMLGSIDRSFDETTGLNLMVLE